ncbi:MAG TPA: aminopeptidase P family protein [Cyclobacteriaceae bacterium]|nr:aminopeptidase P family protein [Cyclobacteriaceae bacterium]HMV10118.1 aminopeptidase P family protein [Cyclobacteriaceae bacterium]HMV88671.1 aminopeptidase P family protein [Cyclobacteriaceae bacterium]HMX00567.1 aminopeptidase P family protein [Cyclobacteriaceae bacterium]HMX49558.1 aminopeptidase P family protein [Cyclobacteriaceae bacterium]
MKRLLSIFILLLTVIGSYAQNSDLPADFLNKGWYKERRQKLRESLPANSVAVFFANAVRNRANDVDYVYHQDPNFYYLTGYREPEAVLFVFKDKQTAANGTQYDEIIFVQERNAMREMWTGRRLGAEGTKTQLGLDQAFNGSDFKKYKVDFSKFAEILFYDFKNDVRDNVRDSADLYSLIEEFKVKVNYPRKDATTLNVAPEQPKNNLNTRGLFKLMADLRGIKTPEEVEMLRKAVMISCIGQAEVMKAITPGMSEREVQGIHEYVFKKYQAEDLGYPSIVGGGHNGCILHYIDNYKPSLTNKELILMDLGAEFHGYTADITRTVPVNGKFSPEQKAIYELVLKAQEASMAACKPGVDMGQLTTVSREVINKGLADLGIIKSADEKHMYFPHGVSHHIGLDVHDAGGRTLQENMAITIEPGIYIPDDSKCDKKWWGIAVRIEDDYLVNKEGCELLSGYAPRTVAEIEAMMKQSSPLDKFKLPALESIKK